MRYEIQWFPKGGAEYNVDLLYKATASQPNLRNVEKVPYINRYNPSTPMKTPEAVQFTTSYGGYDTTQETLININKYLMKATKTKLPQGLNITAVSTIERKKNNSTTKSKRTNTKCKCK